MLLHFTQQCTGNLQCDTGTGQRFEALPHQKGMQQIKTWKFLIHGMMIGYDHIHPSVSCLCESIQRLDSVIDGYHQAVALFVRQLYSLLLQSIAFRKTVRYIEPCLNAVTAQRVHQDGGGTDTVCIIIPAYHNLFLILLCLIDACCDLLHTICGKRVCQLRLLQKLSYLFIL